LASLPLEDSAIIDIAMAVETTDLEAQFTKKFKFRRLENVKLKKEDVYQCKAWQVINV
jgi:hypothetical protein